LCRPRSSASGSGGSDSFRSASATSVRSATASANAAPGTAAASAAAPASACASAARAWLADRSASGISGSSSTMTNPTTIIAAPIRKTVDIESENPTLNGCAMTGASREMKRRVVQVGVARSGGLQGRRLIRVAASACLEPGRAPHRVERVGDPARQRAQQHRQENGGAERAAHLPEERHRRGRDADLARRDRVLDGQDDRLHVPAEARARRSA
jgi:hypothetical protein